MNVIFVLGREVNPKAGGVERVTHVLSDYFLKAGIKVYFLYFRIKQLSFPEYNKEVGIFFLPDDSEDIDTEENRVFLRDTIIKNNIDIVINQGNIADSLSALIAQSVKGTDSKVVSILHNTPFIFSQFYGQYKQTLTQYLQVQQLSLKNIIKRNFLVLMGYEQYIRKYKKYLKISIASSTRFVLLSQGYIPLLCKILKVKKINNAIAIANPSSFKDSFSVNEIDSKKKQVIYVGRLEYNQKRLDRLVDVWGLIEKQFPDWQLIIVGGSLENNTNEKDDYQAIEMERLKALSKNLHLRNIIFAGNRDPVPYYKESSIICLTSNYEGFPMVLVEAFQYGVVPVVFGSFAAIYDCVEHNHNGMIAAPFNLTKYAALLSELMQNGDKRKTMAINAVETSKKYSYEVIAEQWIQTFRELSKK